MAGWRAENYACVYSESNKGHLGIIIRGTWIFCKASVIAPNDPRGKGMQRSPDTIKRVAQVRSPRRALPETGNTTASRALEHLAGHLLYDETAQGESRQANRPCRGHVAASQFN